MLGLFVYAWVFSCFRNPPNSVVPRVEILLCCATLRSSCLSSVGIYWIFSCFRNPQHSVVPAASRDLAVLCKVCTLRSSCLPSVYRVYSCFRNPSTELCCAASRDLAVSCIYGRGRLTLRGQQRQEIDELWTDVGVGIIALSNKQVSVIFLFCLCMIVVSVAALPSFSFLYFSPNY